MDNLSGNSQDLDDSFERSLKLAFEMQNAGRTPEAEALCRMLVQLRPKDAQLLYLLGMILHKTGREHAAIEYLSSAAQYQPHSARIFNGLGCAFNKLEDYAHAAKAFERAMELESRSVATCYHLGNTYYKLDQIERAAALFRQAVEIDSRDSACWNNLGKCLKELNRLEDSLEAYNQALEIAPGYVLAHYGRAISLLTAGRLLEGFQEYEWRQNPAKARQFSQPVWKGEFAPDKTLLIHAEQGFGDAVQMLRFVPMARERVGRVVLECRPELKTLFQYSRCADVVVPFGAPIPAFDCVVSMMSLPHVLGVMLDTIPNSVPYVRAPLCKSLPSDQSGRLKVGLVWAGNPTHHQDAVRSIPLEELDPILRVPHVSFYSLQNSVPVRDEPYLRSKADLIHVDQTYSNFLETASAVAQLDLVIAVDTAVAHLAGALGKPVWTLIQHSPDWRWLMGREDTPWYPTMRLYRQAKRNDWELLVRRVAEALRRLSVSTLIVPGRLPKIEPQFSYAISAAA